MRNVVEKGKATMMSQVGEIYEFWHSRIPEEELPSVEASVQEMLEGKVFEN